MRQLILAAWFVLAPALWAAGAKAPLPAMKPCVPIDELNITNLERVVFVKYVAKTDYRPQKGRKQFYDRLPTEPEGNGAQR